MATFELTPREVYEAALVATSQAATGTAVADYTTEQSVDTLANYSYWRPAYATGFPTITYSFPIVDNDPATPDEPADYIGNGRYGTLRTFSAEQADAAHLAIKLWDDLIPLDFQYAGSDANADMRFFNSTLINTAGGAPAGLGTDGDVWIYNFDQNPPNTRDWSVGEFYFGYWMVHEIGHTLGLSHAGGYPGTGYNGLNYLQDSVVYTVMSYNGAADAEVTWAADMATPMVDDIAAVQLYYGADMTTRTGDTVYGFNSNVTDRLPFNFDAMLAQVHKVAPITIWDAGGVDTLDLSKFSADSAIDLHEGGYSHAGGQEMAIGIAYGAVIENAIGGRGEDVMFGNAVGNRLQGGDGNDRLYGGEDVPAVANPRDFVGLEMNVGSVLRTDYLGASGVAAFSGAQFTFEQLIKLAGVPGGLVAFASYNVSGNDNQFLLEGSGTLKLTIANKATYDTGVSVQSLLDGAPHRLSLAWDKASGGVSLYIDGVLAHAGTYTAAIGAAIASGGTLVLGQEQDKPGGGFDPGQVFQGVVGDVRVFNDVRTAQEVADTAFTTLSGTEQGLVHDWRITSATTTSVGDLAAGGKTLAVNGGTVVDTATVFGPDNDTLQGGWGNDALHGGYGDDVIEGNGAATVPNFAAMAGIDLNPAGTTNQYAAISSFGGIAGASGAVKFTIEMMTRISHLPGSEVDFFSYANGQTSNALALSASNNGNLHLTFRGSDFDTGIASSLVTDGADHRLSLTWDGRASGGGFTIYIDGVAVYSGVHTNQASSLNAGGTLVFGQEQDTIGGGFDANQILPGVIADIRVFNTVRSAAEIAADAFAPLAAPNATSGLVANWTATSGNAAAMADALGGTGLTVFGAPDTVLIGQWDDDTLDGGSGNDTLEGGQGDDGIDGGDGTDTAVFDGARSDYQASYAAATHVLTLVDLRAGAPEGADTITNVELFQFAGAVLTLQQVIETAPTLATPIADSGATEDASFVYTLPAGTFADADPGDAVTLTAAQADGAALPGWLAFDAATRTFSGTPANADVGTVHVKVTATDTLGASASDTFDIVVSNTNDAPTLATPIADSGAAEDASFVYTLPAGTFADADPGDAVTLTAAQADGAALPGWLAFDAATRTFSGTPANADVGTVHVKVTATDTLGASVSDTFDIVVSNTNDAPTLATPLGDNWAVEAAPFAFTVPVGTFADLDAGDTLSLSATKADGTPLPAWLSFSAATGALSGTPAHADVGVVPLVITATDGSGASVSAAFDLTVTTAPEVIIHTTGTIAIGNASVVEGDSGTATMVFTVTRTGGTLPFDVGYATRDGIAMVEDNDYVARSGTLHFAEGATSATIAVTVNSDVLTEGDQSFFVTLAGATNGATLGNAVGVGTIVTDDTAPPANTVFVSVPGAITHTGDADDLIVGSAGADTLFGDAGDDTVFAGAGSDSVYGGADADTLVGNADIFGQEHDLLDGGAGDDKLYGEFTDTVSGGAGYDIVYAVNAYDWSIDLGAGSIELMIADFGNDTIDAGTQTIGVEVVASGGNDIVTGSGFDDRLWGGIGDDVMHGGGGADMLFGDLGVDRLFGDAGNDILYVDGADAVVDGGAGYDVIYITTGTGMTIDMAAQGIEFVIDLASGANSISAAGLGEGANIYTGGGTDTITGSAFSDVLWAMAGADTISGGAGADVLVGGTGADVLTPGSDDDRIYANSGGGGDGVVDRIVLSTGWGSDIVYDFEHGIDTIDLSALHTSFAALTLGTTADGGARVTIGGDTLVVWGLGGVLSQSDFTF